MPSINVPDEVRNASIEYDDQNGSLKLEGVFFWAAIALVLYVVVM